jgi:eukaryotic-like serine/threonine-protein kinase
MSDHEPHTSAPQVLAGRYELGRPLGTDRLGTLAVAVDRALDRRVAVRLLPAHRVSDPATRDRLLEATRAAAAITHPSLAAVTDLGVSPDGTVYVVTELADGRLLQEAVRADGPRPTPAAAGLAGQLCAALAAVHAQGRTHGTVDPGSLLLTDDGTVKLLDCGLAPTLGLAKPPGSDAGRRADLAGVGRCVYELVTGQPPDQRDPDTLVADLPAGLRAAVGAALRRRCVDAAALADALQRGAAQPDQPHRPPPAGDELVRTLTRPPRQGPRRALAVGVVAAVIVLAAAALAGGPLAARQPTSTSAVTTPRLSPAAPPTSVRRPPPPTAAGTATARRVPSLTGVTQAAATKLLAAAGLRVGRVYRQRSDRAAAGTVLASGPPAGREVPAGTPVTLVVSARAGPGTVAELIKVIDRDPAAVGRRGRTYRGRLAGLADLHGHRRRAELADLLGIARAGGSNGDFTGAFSRDAVGVLAPLVQVRDLAAMAAQFPDQVGPAAGRFARVTAARLERPTAAVAAALARDARALAATGQLSAKFAAAALEVLGRVR